MTMQPNDRELLELAAKAAQHIIIWDESGDWCYIPENLAPHNRREGDKHAGIIWNPLTDDGDALRLAVKLHLPMDFYDANVDPEYQEVRIGYGAGPLLISETLSADPYAAIRRAIVRAAAEIGRSRT